MVAYFIIICILLPIAGLFVGVLLRRFYNAKKCENCCVNCRYLECRKLKGVRYRYFCKKRQGFIGARNLHYWCVFYRSITFYQVLNDFLYGERKL